MTRSPRAYLAACVLAACTVAEAQVRPVLPEVRDEGVTLGFPYTLDFTGAGVTCTRVAKKVTCAIAGGGGPGGSLPVTTSVLVGDGAGGAAAYAGTSCAYAVKTLGASGAATCTAAPTIPTDTSAASFVTTAAEATLSGERVLAAGSGTTVNTGTAGQVKIDVTTPVASATTAATASALVADPADCLGVGEFSKGITAAGAASGCAVPPGTYALPAATNAAAGGVIAPACGAGNHYSSISAGTLQCTADTGGAGGGADALGSYLVQTATNAPANAQVMGLLGTGLVKNTTATGEQSIAVAADLPGGPYLSSVTAHALMGATHSDVDTAAAAAGDLVLRNAANTQWTHQAIGGANTVLHGGATAPAYSAVADADLTGTVGIAHGGTNSTATATNGGMGYGTGTAHAYTGAGTAGQVPRSAGAGAPVWVGVQSCTSSATTTCTITVARSGCAPVCSMGTSSASATLTRSTVATTTLTCTFSASGSNVCNCFCP